jgi:hypothetical protein
LSEMGYINLLLGAGRKVHVMPIVLVKTKFLPCSMLELVRDRSRFYPNV